MPRHQRVTIKEIARMTGVSTQTVSRVINNRPDVSPDTRAAVEAAIAETGFRPSAVARSLVQRRSRTLGVIASGLRFFGVAQTLNGVTQATHAADYGILLKELASLELPDIAPVLDFLVAHRVEGIIFASPQYGENVERIQAHVPAGYPPIVFVKSKPSRRFTTISVDNVEGGRMATQHLLALGRRHIGHVTGPLQWLEASDRRDAWQATMEQAGLPAIACVEGNWSSASGEASLERLLAQDPELDAVFAGNDQMALGILRAAHGRGLRIPDDLAVIGFDGLDESAQFTPSLSTVRQPLGEIGRLAVRELLDEIDAEAHPAARTIVLRPELVVRESAPEPGASTGETAVAPSAGSRA